MTDTDYHTYYMSPTATTQKVKDAMNWHMPRLQSVYGMTAVQQSSSNTSTDFVVFDSDYTTQCGLMWDEPGANKIGLAKCGKHWSYSDRCDRHNLRFDTGDTDGFGVFKNKVLACHEVGHGLGLKHRFRSADPGCMKSSLTGGVTSGYSAHDDGHFSNL